MNSAASRVIKNTGILYVRMGVTVFISLYSTRLILNALGVVDYGIFNVVAGVIAMLTFLNAAMSGATLRFISFAEGSGDWDKVRTIFNVSLVLHIAIAIIAAFLLEIIGFILFKGVLKIPEARIGVAKLIYQFMIFTTLLTIISVPYDAVINAHENMLLFAILGVIEALLKLAIAIYITVCLQDKLIVYGLLTAISSVILLLIRRIYCHRRYKECDIDFKQHYSKDVFKEMYSFAGWNLLGTSSSMIANYGQNIIVNMFFGTSVNAAQGISAQVSGQLGAFATTMLRALNPVIDKSEGGGDRGRMLKATESGSKFSFFLLIFFYVPVLIEMPYIFNLWLKNVPEYTIIFCRLLLIRNLIEQFAITINSAIMAVGKIGKYMRYSSIIYFAPILFSFIAFSLHYPPYYLYIIFLIFTVLNLSQTIYCVNKYSGLSISYYLKNILARCFLILILIYGFSLIPSVIMKMGLIRLISVSLTSTIMFCLFVFYLGLTSTEKSNFLILWNKIFRKVTSLQKTVSH